MARPEEKIKQSVMMLQAISEETKNPRKISSDAEETKTILLDEKKTTGLRAADALSLIDEISNDPNMPVYARTSIWQLVSTLEAVPLD